MPERNSHSPIAVSIGDPSGIGPDIILGSWQQRSSFTEIPFFVVGSTSCLQQRAKLLGIEVEFTDFAFGKSISEDVLPVLDTGHHVTGTPGKPDSQDAQATIAAIETSVSNCFSGKASAVVTCPINKKVLYEAGFEHSGHTEFLAALASTHTGKEVTPVMMLVGPELRTVPVTIHIPLSRVFDHLTSELVIEICKITVMDLQKRFAISNPRLAIAGLNPHAGESGSMGREDIEIIEPAVAKLQESGIDAVGPLPADTMFHAAARTTYDVAICMYHDQALIPAKTLGFDDAVNVTLGLPFIRTSPDHGTAYDIAGTGKANPSSFMAALKMAHEMGKSSGNLS